MMSIRLRDFYQEWDSFGRVLCELFVDLPDGTTLVLAEELRKNGHEKV
jgi:hypothetical protein